jgi:UDP-N-acetylglucosamine:LPS N-acetylglucosamine transferase
VRVLIVTAATGQGHVSAARALAETLSASGTEARVLDAGQQPAIRNGAAAYNFFLRRPPGWMSIFYAGIEGLRVSDVGGFLLRPWAAEVFRRERPEVVVSVHPIFNQGIAGMLARHGSAVPFAVVLTDLFPPFWRGWAERRAALTVVPTAAAAREVSRRGVPAERIAILGMPVSTRFRRPAPESERLESKRQLGLEPDRFTLLVNAGSAGRMTSVLALEALVRATDLHERVQVLFLAGSSTELARRASAVSGPFPIRVLGWREDVDRILDAADAVFTKPGALTIAEALGKGVPLLLDTIDGVFPHERGGAEWAAGEDVAWLVRRPEDVPAILRETAPGEWSKRRERCARAVPGDAEGIARRILDLA